MNTGTLLLCLAPSSSSSPSALAPCVRVKVKRLPSKFWEQFAKNLKLGVHEDSQNRNKLADLMRYRSSKPDEDMTCPKDYVSLPSKLRRVCSCSPPWSPAGSALPSDVLLFRSIVPQ